MTRIYTGRPKQVVIWEGQSYESYRAAARELGVSLETVRQRHLKGQKSFADLGQKSKYDKSEKPILAIVKDVRLISKPTSEHDYS